MRRDLNAVDVRELTDYVAELKESPEKCNIRRTLRAEWVGGTRARAHSSLGKELLVGRHGDFGGMKSRESGSPTPSSN